MPRKNLLSEAEAKKLRQIDAYTHESHFRTNNPPSGLARYDTLPQPPHTYSFDPHTSPTLDWAGKSEGLSFSVPTLSLHVHEAVKPHKILRSVQNQNETRQLTLFESRLDRINRRNQALEFYQHSGMWSNRMIAGDSLIIMNSLLMKENMAGQVQTVYIDPPYGIKYGSNFQPFVGKKDVKDRNDDDLSTEPEMIRAFRDTWELGVHSYLTYLRNRLLLVRELLSESGSVFVQISDENVHLVRNLCDEVFGAENFVSMISLEKTSGASSSLLATINDYIVWYAKDKERVKYHQLYKLKELGKEGTTQYTRRDGDKIFALDNCTSAGAASQEQPFIYEGRTYYPSKNRHWRVAVEGMKELARHGRLQVVGNTLMYKQYLDDFPVAPINNVWDDAKMTGFTEPKRYVVQTASLAIARCILMTSDPGDLILDITCGSGTTAFTAEQWGRRWITCDTSRVALAIARQRLLTATFPYYSLADPETGISAGFRYKTVPHITLKSIANNEPPSQEILYDQPETDTKRIRVTGPFTVEALPAPVVFSPEEAIETEYLNEGAKLSDWREQLLATGILGRGGERIRFARIEPLTGRHWLNAEGETVDGRRTAVCFAGESSLMDSARVEGALDEAEDMRPAPEVIVFAAFQFDPEAARMIAAVNWQGIAVLQVQMNPDMMTEDLRRKVRTDQSFWLVGQPDAELEEVGEGLYRVKVLGFDYYNPSTNKVESGNADKIAMWLLDTDYDRMTLEPSQVFFPMEGVPGDWTKLAKTLRAEIDAEALQKFAGHESLPFECRKGQRVAVKIIDNRGIESMRILTLDE
ncbi:MAG: site-specific DNA-methyltransferase [Synergistaceae bacterium]|nr:site-specific DNA-methyltransferase [Synergistaceae bacterium]